MQPFKSEICVICETRKATTRDHIPPKGLFIGVKEPQLITVPACRVCNNGDSDKDEVLRLYISLQIGKQQPETELLWDKGAYKSLERKTKLCKELTASICENESVDYNGNSVIGIGFYADSSIYQAVFERTTRGLYFHHTGRILPQTTQISVKPLLTQPKLDTADLNLLKKNSIGGEACVYTFGIENENNSLWLYEFYGAHWILVMTGDVISTLS
jgi:hypothetical protein